LLTDTDNREHHVHMHRNSTTPIVHCLQLVFHQSTATHQPFMITESVIVHEVSSVVNGQQKRHPDNFRFAVYHFLLPIHNRIVFIGGFQKQERNKTKHKLIMRK